MFQFQSSFPGSGYDMVTRVYLGCRFLDRSLKTLRSQVVLLAILKRLKIEY